MSNQFNSDLISDMARLSTICADKPFTSEDNNRLYPRVAKGDPDARQKMIEGNMPLVVERVDAYLAENPHLAYLRDDLTSCGFLTLVRAVNNMQTRQIKSPTSYLSVRIRGSIRDLIENEPQIRARRQSKWNARAKGKEINVPHVVSKVPDVGRLPLAPQANKVEARDLLRSCCMNDMERTILRLRESGCTYEQIAARVPCSKSEIDRIVDRIEADYYRKRGLRVREEQA